MSSWKISSRKSERFGRSASSTRHSLDSTLLQIVDISLAGIVFIAPLFWGGRHLLGRFVFICLACTASAAWFLRQCLVEEPKRSRTWANVIGLSAIVLVAVQLIPLDTSWLAQLSPRNISLLQIWNGPDGTSSSLGAWSTLSIAPSSTRVALATLIAYFLLFVCVVGRLERLSDIERLMQALAVAAVLMAVFGVIQYFSSNELFFWTFNHPYSTTADAAKGSFTCRKHYAHFLVLGLGPLLAWVTTLRQQSKDTKSRFCNSNIGVSRTIWYGLHLGLGAIVLGLFLSLSRGGILTFFISGSFCLACFFYRKLISGTYLGSLFMIGFLAICSISVSDYETISTRLNAFVSGSIEDLDHDQSRRKIWSANLAAIEQGGLCGSGAGSHRDIYPVYLPESMELEFTHAENGYLQVATENGWLGIALMVSVILLVISWCWKALRHAKTDRSFVLFVAITSGMFASLVQSVFDFVWFIPSCMSLTILLAAAAFRLAQLERNQSAESMPFNPIYWKLATGATYFAIFWAVSTTLGPAIASLHLTRYQILAKHNKSRSLEQLKATEIQENFQGEELRNLESMVLLLQTTVNHDPDSAIGHLRLAGRLLQLFNHRQLSSENAMTADQIRDAAFASGFQSGQALKAWLIQAFGEDVHLLYQSYFHVKKAIQLAPLQGSGYLYLAQLCFLEGNESQRVDAYIAQGLIVRPYDGDTLFEAGRMKLIAGNFEDSLNLWKKIFPYTGGHQSRIVKLLAGQIPANLFVGFFEPDWNTLRFIWQEYSQKGNVEELQTLLTYSSKKAEETRQEGRDHKTAHIFYDLAKMFQELNYSSYYLHYLQQAQTLSPNVFAFRRALGQELLRQQQFELARPHLKWCLARHPENTTIQQELIQATKKRIPQISQAGSVSRH